MTSSEYARTAQAAAHPAPRTAPDCSGYVEVDHLGAACAVTVTPYRPLTPRTPDATEVLRREA
jgi:hypothetical protein